MVGPLLDRFRHGRRYALAATMLGRAFLAWLISDYIHGIGLYPAAFGVLAAVPGLRGGAQRRGTQAAARQRSGCPRRARGPPCSAPSPAPSSHRSGAAAFWFGPQWPLRVASVIFVIGMVIALRLPGRADSDPPETVPRIFVRGGQRKVLSGKLIISRRRRQRGAASTARAS